MKWGKISEARFILSSKFEHNDSNLLRFLEKSKLIHSKLKFELMRSNILPGTHGDAPPVELVGGVHHSNMGQFAETHIAEFGKVSLPSPFCRIFFRQSWHRNLAKWVLFSCFENGVHIGTFVVDSGASSHIFSDRTLFTDFSDKVERWVKNANESFSSKFGKVGKAVVYICKSRLFESDNIMWGISDVCTLALTVAKTSSYYACFAISVPVMSLLRFDLA